VFGEWCFINNFIINFLLFLFLIINRGKTKKHIALKENILDLFS